MNMKSRTVACGVCIAGLSFATATTGVVKTTTALSENQKSKQSKVIESKVLKNQTSHEEIEETTAAIMEQILTTPRKISLKISAISQEEKQQEEQKKEQKNYNQTKFITNITDGYLNVRVKGNKQAEVIGKLYVGAGGKIVEYGKKWSKIKSGKVKGFVATEYLAYGEAYEEEKAKHDTILKGITVKEEQKQLEKQRLAEEKERAKEEQRQQTEKESLQQSGEAVAAVKGEEYLLACLVQAEAGGEIYEGKLAVANVVLNRVQSGSFADSITDVIYQSGQFSVVNNGSLSAIMEQGPTQECIDAANDALAGNNNVEGYYFFRSKHCSGYVETPDCRHIGNQIFYQ